MNVVPEKKSRYAIIAENLRQRIDVDEFAVRLPTIPDLADHYGVGEITMRRAITLLKHPFPVERQFEEGAAFVGHAQEEFLCQAA